MTVTTVPAIVTSRERASSAVPWKARKSQDELGPMSTCERA